AHEVPSNNSAATGRASVGLTADSITVTLDTQGLTDALAAHIHCALAGENGPIIFALYSVDTDGPLPAVFTKRVTAGDLQPAGDIMTFADALAAIASGECYVNIHTSAFA